VSSRLSLFRESFPHWCKKLSQSRGSFLHWCKKLSQACGGFSLWAANFLVYAVLWNRVGGANIGLRGSLFQGCLCEDEE
jgi:hypothetical protein